MKQLDILYLYPNEMNTYGDRGNMLTLVKRAEWHGYKPIVHYQHPGAIVPERVDIVLGGGGQDSVQEGIQRDIMRLKPFLFDLADKNVPMLVVCGTYQIFGRRYITKDGQEMPGISIFDLETIAGQERAIGNVLVESEAFGQLVGFENHSGLTYLAAGQTPLGKVVRGRGNNGKDGTEGAVTNSAIGTYLHGPVLPNNPAFADHLLKLAIEHRYGSFEPQPISDTYEKLVRANALKRSY